MVNPPSPRALIFPPSNDPASATDHPPLVCGVPADERMRRQLRAAGFEVETAQIPPGAVGQMLVVDRRWMIDQRLLAALAALGPGHGLRAGDGHWVAAWAAGDDLATDPEACLQAPPAGLAAIDPVAVDPYVQTSRREIPVRLAPLQTPADAAAAQEMVLADAQKGVLDWPARFLHPPIENALVRLLWRTAVTPNQLSIAGFVMGLAAAALFVAGQLGWGLLLALVCGALDGVDGKLARTRLMVTAAGEWEHVADKVVEYLWYLGLAAGLWRLGAGLGVFLYALLTVASMAGDLVVAGEAQKRLGRQLDDLGPFERGFRLIAARRNTHMWLLVPFALFGAWEAGLAMIAISAPLTLIVHLWRLGRAVALSGAPAPG